MSINCGAIPENLLESELFGHVKGAFTGANTTRIGRFELCRWRDAVLLDEIGNMPQSLQVKLLRVLQEREFERVGGNTTIEKVDGPHHRGNKFESGSDGERRHLPRRSFLQVECHPLIDLPPLRERREDIPLLVLRFISHFCEAHKLE